MEMLVSVREIKGHCPVYEVGDSFRLLDGFRLVAEKPLCMHSLACVMPFYNALRFVSPTVFGMAARDDQSKGCFQCPDAVSCTDGGTVIFEVTRVGP